MVNSYTWSRIYSISLKLKSLMKWTMIIIIIIHNHHAINDNTRSSYKSRWWRGVGEEWRIENFLTNSKSKVTKEISHFPGSHIFSPVHVFIFRFAKFTENTTTNKFTGNTTTNASFVAFYYLMHYTYEHTTRSFFNFNYWFAAQHILRKKKAHTVKKK